MVALICLACWAPNLLASQANSPRRVLILNEVGPSYPLIDLIDQGVRGSLSNSPYRIEFYREYMETVLFPDPVDQRMFWDSYIRKYEHRRPDVIITVGPAPLKFMLESHEKSFEGIPVVYCLPSKLPGHSITDPEFTGIESDIAPGLTLVAALHLLPHTRHVVVVGGTAPFDRGQQADVKEQLKAYADRLEISYLTDLSLPALLERLKTLPQQSIILLTPLGKDADGRTFNSSEIGPMIIAAANAPVFSLTDRYLGHGEVGGDISSGLQQGKLAGSMVLRLLKGEAPKDVPSVRTATAYTFDWRALKRWGLKDRNLPPGSIVLNREPSFWETYRKYLLLWVVVLLGQTAAIVALLWHRARRRKIEAELRKSEQKFSKAFQKSPLAFTLVSLVDYRFLEVNDTFTDYAGWARDEVIGRTPQQLNLWVNSNQRSGFIEQVRNSGAVRNMELLFRRKDGGVWTGLVSSELIEVNGEAAALSLIADITDVKRAEEVRRQGEAHFRLVANTAPVMIWMSGLDKLCTYVNQPWLEFTGHTLDQELGSGWAEGIHPDDRDDCLKTYFEAFDRRQRFEFQYRLRRHDGEYRWVIDIGVPRFNPDGSFAGYIGSGIDVTEQKQAEEALSSLNRRLIEAQEEERSRIGRELHDDVNQQLALLAVNLDQLDHNSSIKDLRRTLQESKRRVMEIAADVQALSHELHSSKLEYLGLAGAAKSFCREFSEMYKVQVVFLQENVPSDLPSQVSLSVFRVLQEALHNGVKHSGADYFEVQLSGNGGELQLSVRDSGKGFDVREAMHHRGLGLISMRERISFVKGTVTINSQPQRGTEVLVRVPLPTVESVNEVTSGAA